MTRKKRGFTLIEVTLAIVVGIILVAGATLIYNQARQSAGNSRANQKVVAMQTVVEEFAAMNGGLYPEAVGFVQAMWERRRPDDFNKSPWGGQVGSFFSGTTAKGVSGVDNATRAFTTLSTIGGRSADGADPSLTPNQTLTGGMVYEYGGSDIWSFDTDLKSNKSITVRAMAVYVCDQMGRYPNFIVGGRTQ